ncbi:MAG: hypothetical protein KA004_07580 [Verrucomicrobiales bacterium]|nr:hypothetical protein [Verrucomicrobiales bacterium]
MKFTAAMLAAVSFLVVSCQQAPPPPPPAPKPVAPKPAPKKKYTPPDNHAIAPVGQPDSFSR